VLRGASNSTECSKYRPHVCQLVPALVGTPQAGRKSRNVTSSHLTHALALLKSQLFAWQYLCLDLCYIEYIGCPNPKLHREQGRNYGVYGTYATPDTNDNAAFRRTSTPAVPGR